MYALISCTAFVWKNARSKEEFSEMIKNVYWSSCKGTRYSCGFEWKLSFRDIFEKYSNIKFHENPSDGSLVVPCGQTDTYTTKLIVVFRNFANAPKSISCELSNAIQSGRLLKKEL